MPTATRSAAPAPWTSTDLCALHSRSRRASLLWTPGDSRIRSPAGPAIPRGRPSATSPPPSSLSARVGGSGLGAKYSAAERAIRPKARSSHPGHSLPPANSKTTESFHPHLTPPARRNPTPLPSRKPGNVSKHPAYERIACPDRSTPRGLDTSWGWSSTRS
jgi:hypothetical protein